MLVCSVGTSVFSGMAEEGSEDGGERERGPLSSSGALDILEGRREAGDGPRDADELRLVLSVIIKIGKCY